MKAYLVMKSTTQSEFLNASMDYAKPYSKVHSAYFNEEEALHVCDVVNAYVGNRKSDNDDEKHPDTYFWVLETEVQ